MPHIAGTSRPITYEQKVALVAFMEDHKDFAQGRLRAQDAKRRMETLRVEMAAAVNSAEGGAMKTPDQCKSVSIKYLQLELLHSSDNNSDGNL